jgi:presenilin-like A22 family membrane protease
LNFTFTGIFIWELVIKVAALGPMGYIRDPMNDFDCIIVIFSIIDLATQSLVNLQAFRSLRILRTLRVLRVTKLLRSLAFMKVIIKVLSSCLINFLNICKSFNPSGPHDHFHLYLHFAGLSDVRG